MLRDVVIDRILEPVVMLAWANAKLAVLAAMTNIRGDRDDMTNTGVDATHKLLLRGSTDDGRDSLFREDPRLGPPWRWLWQTVA